MKQNKVSLLFFLSIPLLIAACSSADKKDKKNAPPPQLPNAEKKAPVSTPGFITRAQVESATKVSFNSNELITKVSEYVAQNPEATLKSVVQNANSLREKLGLPFTLIADSAEIIGSETFVTTLESQRLNVGLGSEPLCATGIAITYPALKFQKNTWGLVYGKDYYRIKASPVRWGEIRREKDNKLITRIPLPEEGIEPGGISSNGLRILTRFDLNPSTSSWWQRVMNRNPREEKPFLILTISENDFSFSYDEDDYSSFDEAPPKETPDEESYIIRFEDSKYYFKSAACN